MKFCKKLQQVADLADPDWAPYWTNYKLMKKQIKTMKGDTEEIVTHEEAKVLCHDDSIMTTHIGEGMTLLLADKTAGYAKGATNIQRDSREVDFFRLLHAEFQKATKFFQTALQEMMLREERIRAGFQLLLCPSSVLVTEKWSAQANCSLRLHKQLLLLESFAIMTFCSVSKILKKHDKVTGHTTRAAFMQKVVAPSNISQYPLLLQLISRCEEHCERVSQKLVEQDTRALYDDEKLFLEMVHRFRGNPQLFGRREAARLGNHSPLTTNEDVQSAADTLINEFAEESGSDDDQLPDSHVVHEQKNRIVRLRSLPMSRRRISDEDEDDAKPQATRSPR